MSQALFDQILNALDETVGRSFDELRLSIPRSRVAIDEDLGILEKSMSVHRLRRGFEGRKCDLWFRGPPPPNFSQGRSVSDILLEALDYSRGITAADLGRKLSIEKYRLISRLTVLEEKGLVSRKRGAGPQVMASIASDLWFRVRPIEKDAPPQIEIDPKSIDLQPAEDMDQTLWDSLLWLREKSVPNEYETKALEGHSVIAFLREHPGSDDTEIVQGTGIRDDDLSPILYALEKRGIIIRHRPPRNKFQIDPDRWTLIKT
mgnify:CR=1 FL=1